ncbi:DpnD/PcfM family protein [Thiopseudomonas alkaliphila]|uniref:DpnD/PcfM family protein n=1 Tax=Thiopseudomonas alkaliphila TaxID=1697053 RepID=UPI0025780283|nr:DpnD/PcfM family protein [Thiopseudomonas alkaliphila]MDM1715679.1 protein DpnD [Thiopseudomonas alkaliphila]
MKTFNIEVQEILSRTISIQSTSIEEAIETANNMYESEEIVLDYNDLSEQRIVPSSLIYEKADKTDY